MISYGAPVLRRSHQYDRGDYLLTESRRIVPGPAVRNPARGSATSAAATLVALGMEVPVFVAEAAASELLGERERLPEWLRR